MRKEDVLIGMKVKVLGNTWYKIRTFSLPQIEQGYGYVIRTYDKYVVLGTEKDSYAGDTFNYEDIEPFEEHEKYTYSTFERMSFKSFELLEKENGKTQALMTYNLYTKDDKVYEKGFVVCLDGMDSRIEFDCPTTKLGELALTITGETEFKDITPQKMTIKEIEEKLGYKIQLVKED